MMTELISGLDDVRIGDVLFVTEERHGLEVKDHYYLYTVLSLDDVAQKLNVDYTLKRQPDRHHVSFITYTTFKGLRWGRILTEIPYDPSQEPDEEDDV